MHSSSKWHEAQRAEHECWTGVAGDDNTILRTLSDNQELASRLRGLLPVQSQTALELGIGNLGVGVIGFLPEIPIRIGMDPLSPLSLRCSVSVRDRVHALRKPVRYLTGTGESVPLRDESVDLAICCNVLDHVQDARAVIAEIQRVVRPGGGLFLEVDTFSTTGLLKWHFWTKRRHASEILVRAHPYRFREGNVFSLLRLHGFESTLQVGHSLLSTIFGRSRRSLFWALRRSRPPGSIERQA
jgi:SAM-dependent methyltransferase